MPKKQQHTASVISEKTVFISWSGELGRRLAEGLEKTILKVPGRLSSWMSKQDIGHGELWRQEVSESATRADYGVVCLTPGVATSPWINFEAGYILGRFRKCPILSFGTKAPSNLPLEGVRAIDGTSKDDLLALLKDFLGGAKDAHWVASVQVDNQYEEWRKTYAPIIEEIGTSSPVARLDALVGEFSARMAELHGHHYFARNKCFSDVVLSSLNETLRQIRKLTDKRRKGEGKAYAVSASNYPYYLIDLQKNLRVQVKALALLDYVEHFWSQDAGKHILSTTNSGSRRVFVFKDKEQFNKNREVLREHASKDAQYLVYALHYDELAVLFSPYNRDFSIITHPEDPSDRILAEYDDSSLQKMIRFVGDPVEVERHNDKLEDIIHWATRVEKDSDLDQVWESVGGQLTAYTKRHVEMSDYISIEKYDQHEEEHPYYVPMMEKMIEVLSNSRADGAKPCRVLELGAGTGIFTKRLAQLAHVQVIALEVDVVCFRKLQHNLEPYKNKVTVLLKDSRTFDPDGKFDFIVSSFADHHIKPKDRHRYFGNVKRNLLPHGLFLVGDEFLRSHDDQDKDGRRAALEDYHNHIISIARKEGHPVLVELESEALQSGLAVLDGGDEKQGGDYKVSCEQYEQSLRRAGLPFDPPVKIGPLDGTAGGGIYVYKVHA